MMMKLTVITYKKYLLDSLLIKLYFVKKLKIISQTKFLYILPFYFLFSKFVILNLSVRRLLIYPDSSGIIRI